MEAVLRRLAFLGVSGLALLSLLAPAPAWAQEAGSTWTVCKAEGLAVRTERGFRGTYYLSGAVTSPNDQGFAKAFARYIEEKYLGKSMRGLPSCWSVASEAEARGSIEKKVAASRWNMTYIATGWTNTPAIPAADAMLEGQPAESP